MSLRIWLPLNGDLHNQGISNPNFIQTTTVQYVNNGKIGQAASIGAIKMDATATTTASIFNNNEFSFCCWVYVNADTGDTSKRAMFFGDGSTGQSYSRHYAIFQYPNCNALHIDWRSNNTTKVSGIWENALPSYQWTHIAITYKNPDFTLYLNGNKYATRTGVMNETSYAYETPLFGNVANNGRYLNDYRIYDHCLSAAEVKEIAQGLVLHYKLNDGYIESAKNLCTTNTLGSNAYNGATGKYSYGTTTDMYKTIITRQDCGECTQIKMGTAGLSAYPYVWFDNIHPRQNEYRTLSFDYYPTSQTSVVFYTYSGSATATYTVNYGPTQTGSTIPVILNQWNHITLTLLGTSTNTSGWGYMRIGTAAHTSTTTDYWLFNNIQVELNNHATPYTNNERLSNNLNISTNNLITGLTAGGQTTISNGNTVTTSGTNADTYFRLTLSTPMIKNHLYKLSCNVSGLANDGYWSFPIAGQSNTTIPTFVLKNGYNEVIFRANDACVSAGTSVMMDDNGSTSRTVVMTANNFKLYDVTPIIYDSSGFNNNGTIVGEFDMNTTSPRYDKSLYLHSIDPTTNSEKGISYIQTPLSLTTPLQLSFTWWAKPESGYSGSSSHAAFCTSTQTISPTDYNTTAFHHRDSGFDIYPSDGSGVKRLSFTYTLNQWHHYAVTYDGTTARAYQDGELKSSIEIGSNKTLASFSQLYIGFSRAGSVWRKTLGSYSDFRVYVTQLLDTDIKQLYNVSMKIDKLGSAHSFEFIEQQSNIIFPIELSRSNLEFTNGLSRYTQANCQVTLTDQGYRIYRPPNLTTANDGNTMWGGLKLVNQSTDTVSPYNATRDNIWNLQTGHTYMIAFHVKGQSTNAASIDINHNMGNGVSNGVQPTETAIKSKGISANFQGEEDCYYIFTINDDIIKTSNKTSAGYQSDSNYLSYRHFSFGFSYTSTGTLGTDLYLTNFRLYDITTAMAKITKQGQAKFDDFVEQLSKTQIRRNSELLSNQFIER